MNKNLPLALFLISEIVVLAFIVATSGSLPEIVASHFNGSGEPNGFMTRNFYIGFMLVFALGVPGIIAGSMSLVGFFPVSKISLPNKQVWLSEKYRESTFAYMKLHASIMGICIAVFMAYVHWLVIKANSEVPAHLSSEAIICGLVVFAVVFVGWGIMLPVKFMRLPK
jgi:uncharacterized membrane protein